MEAETMERPPVGCASRPGVARFGGIDPGLAVYVREVRRVRPLSLDEEFALVRRAHRGDRRARERLLLANLRLVPAIASQYADLGTSLLDLIEQGNLGLLRAVETYDPSDADFTFCVYASHQIRQAMEAFLVPTRGPFLPDA